jgi:hypothetical protein
MLPTIRPKDIIAIAALIAVIVLVYFDREQGVTEIITGIIGYYFGHRHT